MVKAIVLIMLSIQILLTISTSVNTPGKPFKSYIEQLKHKNQDDPLSIVRSINRMVLSLMKMTDQRQNKNKLVSTSYKMFRRFT